MSCFSPAWLRARVESSSSSHAGLKQLVSPLLFTLKTTILYSTRAAMTLVFHGRFINRADSTLEQPGGSKCRVFSPLTAVQTWSQKETPDVTARAINAFIIRSMHTLAYVKLDYCGRSSSWMKLIVAAAFNRVNTVYM